MNSRVSILPEQNYTFKFTVTAPAAGMYNLSYCMACNGTGFGNFANTTISVVDVTPPKVVSIYPGSKSTGVPVHLVLAANFSEPINPGTITNKTFWLRLGSSNISGTVTYDNNLMQAHFTPDSDLAYNNTYIVTINGVRDLYGNIMSIYRWSFNTSDLISS